MRSTYTTTTAQLVRALGSAQDEAVLMQVMMQLGARTVLRAVRDAMQSAGSENLSRECLTVMVDSTDRCLEVLAAEAARRKLPIPEDL
jgi:hypothetical protein